VNQLYVAVTGFAVILRQLMLSRTILYISFAEVFCSQGAVPGIANSVAHIISEAPSNITKRYYVLRRRAAKVPFWVEPAASGVTVTTLWSNTASGTNGLGRFQPGVGSSSP